MMASIMQNVIREGKTFRNVKLECKIKKSKIEFKLYYIVLFINFCESGLKAFRWQF